MLIEKILETKRASYKQQLAHTNRASEIGHPCSRYLTYRRVSPQLAALPDAQQILRMEAGVVAERKLENDLREAGIQVVEQQRPLEWKAYELSGTLEGKLLYNGAVHPYEIKSTASHWFRRFNTVGDFFTSKYVTHRKWPAQGMLYLLMEAQHEEMLYFLVNRDTGQVKELPLTLDYAYGETLLQRAIEVNRHVKAGTLPERIEYEEGVCGICPFLVPCRPEVTREPLAFVDFPELELKLARRAELAPLAKEYEHLDGEIKDAVKGQEKIVVGDWLLRSAQISRKAHEVKASTYWKTTIEHIVTTPQEEP